MTVEVQVANLQRRLLDAVTGTMFAHGATGVQEDWMPDAEPAFVQPWEDRQDPVPDPVFLRAWFDDLDQPALLLELMAFGIDDVTVRTVEPTDWQAMAEEKHEPVVISERLVVAPPWNAPEGALIIEPGLGFGTGAHPTTRLALERLDALSDTHRTLLDVGTGSGILALAAAQLGLEATAIDNDVDAIADARRQRARSGLAVDLTTTPIADVDGRFDLVLANLNGPLLVRLADEICAKVGRTLFLTGILPEHEAGVEEAFRAMRQDGRWTADPWIGRQYTWPTS